MRHALLLLGLTGTGCLIPKAVSVADTSPAHTASERESEAGTSAEGEGTADSARAADDLRFAIVGDTRPPNMDDTEHYPSAIIAKIWQDVEDESPRPAFALATGDFMFADPHGSEQVPQLELYMEARATFTGALYPVMGNHECAGWTDSNCGPDGSSGLTANYTAFLDVLLAPIGETRPYYEVKFSASDGSWTAKFVMIAANAWDDAQASWLDAALSESTTYTFVVRHEDAYADTAPGVTPSAAIIAGYPLTLLIVGHSHTYAHYASNKEVIVGNGGAPLTSYQDYGYTIVARQSDGTVLVTAYDYETHETVESFSVKADGSPG